MNDQRTILAIALSLAILLAWQFFVAGPQLDKDRAARAAHKQAAEQSETAAPGGAAIPGSEAAGGGSVTREAALAAGTRIAIDSPVLDGSIALDGARFDDIRLKKYRETLDPKSPEIEVLSPRGTKQAYYASFGWAATGGVAAPGADTVWQAVDQGPLTPDHPVSLRWDNGQGLVFIRKIALDDKYMFTVADTVQNTSGAPVPLSPYGSVTRHGVEQHQSYWILHEGLLGVFSGTLQTERYKDIVKDGQKDYGADKPGGWLGITDKYWLAALVPDQAETFSARFLDRKLRDQDVYQADFLGQTKTVPAGGAITQTHHLFAGAKEVGVIDHYAESLGIAHFDLAIDWGWFYFLTRPIFRLLDLYKNLVGNFGVAILLLTITIKALLFPLANRSYASMSKMKKLQPEMARLRERYKDDKAKQQTELMELYKKEKVNPMAGCLPIFIQIPVFFALYKVLFITIEMRHAPFILWIRDLSAPDPTTIVNLFGLIPWAPPPFMHVLGVFPLIMGVTMFLQTKMNPAPADKNQELVFLLMPVVFTFMMGGFPAGLVVYWTWNNTLSITQQYVIMKRMGVDPEWEKKFPRLSAWLRRLLGKSDPVKDGAAKSSSQQPGA